MVMNHSLPTNFRSRYQAKNMNFPIRWSTTVLFAAFATLTFADPVKIIFDTDMGNDVDDALALAMLHSLQSRGESELLAVTITKNHEDVAPYVDALNHFYGRGDIPIGITDGEVTPEKSSFTPIIHEQEGGNPIYPRSIDVGDLLPAAVDLLRETLANQKDQSVVIIQVGFSTNLAALMQTGPDTYSPLAGMDLIRRKVSHISIMAGAFTNINGSPHLEYNIVNDIASAQQVANDWPTPVIWSGFEIGLAIRYPAISIENDFDYVDRHPVAESYQLYIPTPHERPTWDLTSVLWAVRKNRDYFGLSAQGKVEILANGETLFNERPDGLHQYLTINDAMIEGVRELIAALVSEPP